MLKLELMAFEGHYERVWQSIREWLSREYTDLQGNLTPVEIKFISQSQQGDKIVVNIFFVYRLVLRDDIQDYKKSLEEEKLIPFLKNKIKKTK